MIDVQYAQQYWDNVDALSLHGLPVIECQTDGRNNTKD